MQRYSRQWYAMRAASGALFGILGIILFVRMILVPAAPSAKLIGFALPVVMIALAVVRIREYLSGRKAVP
jgi:dolichyl-phosphate-mannose--protein O-mannosyl transferase